MPVYTLQQGEVAELDGDVVGAGGFQGLMRRLQEGLNAETGEVTVSDEDAERIRRCLRGDYGQGGWQDAIARLWTRDGMTPGAPRAALGAAHLSRR